MYINLVFDYYIDQIYVPDFVGQKIKFYQNKCDKWLFNKLNDHEYWTKDSRGEKYAVGICSDAFIFWLNNYVLNDNDDKAYIVKSNLERQELDKSYKSIYY